ncbi:hypothetical protein Holit_01980 [Hollandina sp. SP2]
MVIKQVYCLKYQFALYTAIYYVKGNSWMISCSVQDIVTQKICVILHEHITKTKDFCKKSQWIRPDLIELFNQMILEFNHKETGKLIDGSR